MHILVINQGIPFPPMSGGDVRTHYLVRALAARHQVTLVGFNCGTTTAPPPFPVRVFEQRWEMPQLWKEMVDGEPHVWQLAYEKLLNGTDEPWFVSCMQSAGMEELLRKIVARENFDLAIVNRTSMARFLSVLPPRMPCVLNLHVVHALMAQREVEGKAGKLKELALHEAERTLRFERQVARCCNLCLTVSEREALAAKTLLGIDHLQVVPNGVNTAAFTPGDDPPANGHLLFTGKFDLAPNIEAAHYFAQRILPLVRREIPDATLHLVGANAERELAKLAGDAVKVRGRVTDLAPYYRRAAVVVVPMLHGGGTRQQVLEAAACGKAIVATVRGAEGLDFRPGEDLLVADDPVAFAGAVVRLLTNIRQRRLLEQRARRACMPYEWEKIGAHFCHTIENLVKPISMNLHKPHLLSKANGAAQRGRADAAPVMG